MAESAVSTVLGSLGNRAVKETKFLCGVTLEVTFLKDELMRLQAYLKDADNKWRSGNARVAVLVGQIRDAAYEAQSVIEAADYIEKRNRLKKGFIGAISRYAHLPTDLATIHKIGVDIRRVRRRLDEIFQSAERLNIDLDNTCVDHNEFPQDSGLTHQQFQDDIIMVGFQDEHKEIVEKLVDNQVRLSVVSILAMGGAGKTTLARKVYTSCRVKEHFDTTAWVSVSQTFKGIELLKDIMKQIELHKDDSIDIEKMAEYEVGKKIHDLLMQKRYLVVLDDVWEADTWEQLNRTTNVFPDACNGSRVLLTTRKEDVGNHVWISTHVHWLKKLDEQQSWELFSSKALPSYKKSVTGDVVEFEKLGRRLAKKCEGLPLALAILGGYLSKNLTTQEWSYVLLSWPSTKDTQMMRDILARSYKDLSSHYLRSCWLYIAAFPEDFVIIVSDLIELWIAEGFIPHIPKHKPEETARKYVTELAQRSLVQVVSRGKGHGWIEKIRIHDILRDWCIEEARQDGFLDVSNETIGQDGTSYSHVMKPYRSSLENSNGPFLEKTLNLRTLLGFQISSIPKMSFLRVLHIEQSSLRGISSVIYGCINLRYLRLRRCYRLKISSSITKLLYLQTIDLRGTTQNSCMPNSIWNIPTLRHVYLNDWIFPPPRSLQHYNIQTLVIAFQGYYKEYGIHVCGNILKDDPMLILEKLSCLVVMELKGYKGQTMSFSAQGFPRLQDLTLKAFDCEEWRMEEGTLPKLSYLKLKCGKMSRLPEGLMHLPSLKCLELDDMRSISREDNTLKELQQKGCQVQVE